MAGRLTRQVGLAAGAMSALAAILVTVPGAPSAAQVAPVPNPLIADSCGVDVTLVLDASGSIQTAKAVEQVRGAADAFLEALQDTSSTARVTQFGTVSAELAPATLVTSASLAPGGALRDAITGYYDPRPPKPTGVDFWQYRGGNPQSAGSFRAGSSTEYTNWDQALDQANDTAPNLTVFVTDGDPTAYDFGQSGDPFPAPAVAYQTEGGQAAATTLSRAVEEANAIKTGGTRMLAVGVGNALNNAPSIQRLVDVTGPRVVRFGNFDSIASLNEIDVALVEEFATLARFLRAVVLELCSPSLTVRKLAQSADNPDYLPADGWSITTTPTVSSGTFRWILPDTAQTPSKTVATDADGFSQFQWEPSLSTATSTALVQEALQPGFTPGRPGPANDVRCELRDEDGNVRVVNTELTGTPPGFTLTPIGAEIVTCSVWNSFDYTPNIVITKTNTPTAVRGDVPNSVISAYEVTNPPPGNTPLSNIQVTDDKCGPVLPVLSTGGFNVGDTNTNGLLDLPERWQFRCTRTIQVSRRATAAAQTIVNTATVVGTDPTGTNVTDTATASVAVYVPGISLTKLVNGVPAVTVDAGTAVNYTYAVTNTGNTPLGTVELGDDTCTPVTFTSGDANGNSVLEVGETWNYQCGPYTPAGNVINTAVVTGVPLNPAAGNAPFPTPNPVVTATDQAEVDVVNPGINLEKLATPSVLVLDEAGTPELVTYTYSATNTGDTPLNRPGASGGGPGPTAPGWIIDSTCAPVTYVSGDDGDGLIDPDETWQFTCARLVGSPTLNLAGIIAQPSNPDGTPLPVGPVGDIAVAFVDVLRPDIDIVKTALVGVVLDPGADPIAGPDVPDRRPAQYLYEVTNTGNVALELEPDPPVDDICGPLVFVEGDVDTDELLDPDETWVYTCETVLDREDDANTPPVTGAESGLVTNTVVVNGVPVVGTTPYPDKEVTASDTAQVLVIEPGIALTKTASAPVVLVGGSVTYTFVVTNTGDVGLDVIGPADDECSPLVPDPANDGDGNGLLDGADSGGGGESWTYTCTKSLGLPTPPATTDVNTAIVGAIDPLGNLYGAEATAVVRVFDPAIDLTKTVDESLVPAGTPVTYSFEVTNTGESPLAADDVLANILLVDASLPAVPSCSTPAYVSGDINGDGPPSGLLERLDPPEVWLYQCSAVITESTTDVAVVRGTGGTLFTPPLPVDVSAVDAAFVQVFRPAIEVTKTASPTQLIGGGQVTYTYVVRNTGDVPLADVVARIRDDRCSPLTYVSGDEDADTRLDSANSIFEDALDETWTFTCTTTITATTTNTVVVTGTPTDGGGTPLCGTATIAPCDVSASTSATVTVVGPGTITIAKRTPAATTRSFDFTYGDQRFALKRDESTSFTGLAPGTYLVTEEVPSGWRLERIECVDATGDTVIGLGARRVEIILGAGETVTCTFHNRSTGVLPNTGNGSVDGPLTLAAVAIGIGAALLAATRRRRTAPG